MAGMMTVSTSLIFVVTKGLISPASAGLVLGLCGKVTSVLTEWFSFHLKSCISGCNKYQGKLKLSHELQ